MKEETEVDGGMKVIQRGNSSSSDDPRSPSLCTSEDGDELDSSLDGSMSSSFNQRLAELTGIEEDWRGKLKKTKACDVVQTPLANRFSQLQDSEKAWKKKVDTYVHTAEDLQLAEKLGHLLELMLLWRHTLRNPQAEPLQQQVSFYTAVIMFLFISMKHM